MVTFQEVKGYYEERAKKKAPHVYKKEMAVFAGIKEEIKKYAPEALRNPELLIDERTGGVNRNFGKLIRTGDMFDYGRWRKIKSLCAIIKLIKKIKSAESATNADEVIFERKHIIYCTSLFLEKKGWKNIQPDYSGNASIDITAEKGDKVFKGTSVKSVRYQSNSGRRKNKPDSNPFKLQLGRTLLWLMEAMGENENCEPALFIADDKETRALAIQYSAYIKRMGIKVYMVNSATKIREL